MLHKFRYSIKEYNYDGSLELSRGLPERNPPESSSISKTGLPRICSHSISRMKLPGLPEKCLKEIRLPEASFTKKRLQSMSVENLSLDKPYSEEQPVKKVEPTRPRRSESFNRIVHYTATDHTRLLDFWHAMRVKAAMAAKLSERVSINMII